MTTAEGEMAATYPLADLVGEPLADAAMAAAAALEGADYAAQIQMPAHGAAEVVITAATYSGGEETPALVVTVRLPR